MHSSYLSLTLSNNKMVIVAKTEEDLKKFFEALKKYGVQVSPSAVTRCG